MVVLGKQIKSKLVYVFEDGRLLAEDKWQDTAKNKRRNSNAMQAESTQSCGSCIVSPSSDMQTACEISQYICGACRKCFTNTSKLKQHMLIHTGDKPYTCNLCLKQFTKAGNLKTHMIIHTSIKP